MNWRDIVWILLIIGFLLSPVIIFAQTPATQAVKIQWNISATATSYVIQTSPNGAIWTAITPIVQRCYTYNCKATVSLPTLRLVLVRVMAVNAGGISPDPQRGVWACPMCGPPLPVLEMGAP